jgi:cytochrome c oxidase subunit 2
VVDPRHEFARLAGIYLPIAVAVVVLVALLVVGFAWRYRARPDRGPTDRRSGAPKLESVYAIVLACVAVFLLTRTFPIEAKVDRLSAHPGLTVRVTAAKWRWRFDYPAQHRTNAGTAMKIPTLVVPAHTTVRFVLTSIDVIHAFWIPAERVKRDAFPGRIARFDAEFEKPGFSRYGGECSEFCGLGHTDMRFSVRVLAPGAFKAWAKGGGA